MQNLYDEEQQKIMKVGQDLQYKWKFILARFDMHNPLAKRNRELLEIWHREAINRYRDIGFIAEVDITPALAGIAPPTVSIVSRVEKHEFDFDKKAYEVKKSKEQGTV